MVPYTEHARALIDGYEKGSAFRVELVEVGPGKGFRKTIDLRELCGDLKPGRLPVAFDVQK